MKRVLMTQLACVVVLMLVCLFPADSTIETNAGVTASSTGASSVEGVLANGVNNIIATNTIQDAIDNVNTPDSYKTIINLLAKKYTENVIVDKSLQIVGRGIGNTIVDGTGLYGSVFTIDTSKTVRLSGMTIQNGNAVDGGGVYNFGTLNLDHVLITGNIANYGGGIYNGGTVNMNADSSITANNLLTRGCLGGGIYNGGIANAGTVNMNGGSITGNTAYEGGGIFNYYGTINMNTGSSITGNTALDGAGIFNNAGQTINMDTRSSITGNIANDAGGGIMNDAGTVNMNEGSYIAGNTALIGGGIYDSYNYATGGTVNFKNKNGKRTVAIIPPPGEYDTTTDPYGFFHTTTIPHNSPDDIYLPP